MLISTPTFTKTPTQLPFDKSPTVATSTGQHICKRCFARMHNIPVSAVDSYLSGEAFLTSSCTSTACVKSTVYISYDRRHKVSARIAKEIFVSLDETKKFEVEIEAEIGNREENKYEKITEAIKASELVIIVYNDNYQNNVDCQREATTTADMMKKILFVKSQPEKFRLEDWFYTLKGGRIDVDYHNPDTNPIEKVRWHVFEMFGMNVPRIASGLEVKKYRAINIRQPSDYYDRLSYEQEIMNGIYKVCANPDDGALVIAGEGGVGKTTLLERVLTDTANDDFLLNQCNVRAAVWLNCYEWRDPDEFGVKQQRAVSRALLEKINERFGERTKFARLDEFVIFFKELHEKPLFVLDDVFNENLLQYIRQHFPTIPCCVITRDPVTLTTPLYQPRPLVKQVIRVSELTDHEIVEMLQVTFSLEEKLTFEQLTTLASRCCGLPLITSLLAASLKDAEEEQYNSLIAANVGEMNVGGPYGNVVQLFEFSLSFLNLKLRQAYYAFLLFDPGEPISVVDLAILWDQEPEKKTYTERMCQLLADKSFIRKVVADPKSNNNNNESSSCWLIHQMLHEAATKHAAKYYEIDDVEGALSKLRLRIITGRIGSKKTPHSELITSLGSTRKMVEAVKQRRLLLLSKTVEKLEPADLGELCRQKAPETEGMTFLHHLYTVNWAVSRNAYFGANISYRLIREIIFKLREFKVDFLSVVNENCDEGNARGHCKPRSLREQIFRDKDVWSYTPDRNSLIEILGLSVQKLNDEKKWEDTFQCNETYRSFMSIFNEKDRMTAFTNFITSTDGRSLNKHDQGELTMCAARKGDLEVVAKLIDMFPDSLHYRNRMGLTALMFAAANNHFKIIRLLCEKFVDTAVQDNTGWNALMHATYHGNLETVDFLHQKLVDFTYEKPLMIAASNGYLEIVEYLIDKHPEIATYQDPNNGITPMMCAARCGYLAIVEHLHLITPNAITLREKDGWTALMYAASRGHLDTVDYLYNAYREAATLADCKGLTPLMCAARYGHLEVVCYLFEKDPLATTVRDKDGRTALMHAAASGQAVVVQELKKREASLGSQTYRGSGGSKRSLNSVASNISNNNLNKQKSGLSEVKSFSNNSLESKTFTMLTASRQHNKLRQSMVLSEHPLVESVEL